ncbi:hypothetical protein N7468_002694 [Penicillium chermesinum]|uniref:Alpha/beta hydrolase fold-3 domain-containing protein n=1 Tax=Penicillium chermesinum TaxID=63820 RepID=A0A9W9PIZ8_9EURO|nr:uncharacterized protein N7468_002694 [Penicillium chermesinum]KAJ5247711.1 hypothetical protein N7468_002694 [Penicillium chermesinum]KAJ6151476.1 hypothetical protein N7470_007073 [Penicillium chermesinum]
MALTRAKLTLAEALDFVPALASIVLAGFYALLTGLWRTERQAKTLFLHFGYAIFRQATARLSPRQLQFILPPTNKIYERYARKSGQVAETVELEHGGLGHWVGDRNATNVIVWYHGGGFNLPANEGHFKFFAQIIRDLERVGKSVAIFSLTYTLAPTAIYPAQLRQAVSALRHVIVEQKRDPANVFLAGESAGGNLACGVLSHIAHPHPEIEPLTLSSKLAGAILIAPWTLLDTEFPDQEIYHGGDLITQAVAVPWASSYLGDAKRDYYTDLSNAPTEWFKSLPVHHILITAGGNEILLPLILDFAEKLKTGFPNVELFVGKRECHVAPVYNLELGDNTETEQGKKVKSWLSELA